MGFDKSEIYLVLCQIRCDGQCEDHLKHKYSIWVTKEVSRTQEISPMPIEAVLKIDLNNTRMKNLLILGFNVFFTNI